MFRKMLPSRQILLIHVDEFGHGHCRLLRIISMCAVEIVCRKHI